MNDLEQMLETIRGAKRIGCLTGAGVSTLEAEGVKGHFSTVAWFAKTLVDRRRTDVLDAP